GGGGGGGGGGFFLWGEYGSKDFRCTERRHRKTGTELHNPAESKT
ncbi:hypothetical protein HMPREF9552_05720, partial [Escherichia coli MS 198-1]